MNLSKKGFHSHNPPNGCIFVTDLYRRIQHPDVGVSGFSARIYNKYKIPIHRDYMSRLYVTQQEAETIIQKEAERENRKAV